MTKKKFSKWTDEEKNYLAEITPGNHVVVIQEKMIERFKKDYTYSQIKSAIQRYKFKTGYTGRFEKGCVPSNKGIKGVMKGNSGSFKKGIRPKNTKEVGCEIVDAYGYTKVKIAEPNVWDFKHRLIWEKANGKIPKDSVLIFGDGDKSNVTLENLLLVTKRQLVVMNHRKLIKNDVELTETGATLANLYLRINELKKGEK